jgi:CDP-paratose 2-epimerase
VIGYRGKQVRDQLHCRDVARLFLAFYEAPRCGEVYNMGGGRANSVSILETIDILAAMGLSLSWKYQEANRIGDHVCYISDLSKLRAHFPGWRLEYSLEKIMEDLVGAIRERKIVQLVAADAGPATFAAGLSGAILDADGQMAKTSVTEREAIDR